LAGTQVRSNPGLLDSWTRVNNHASEIAVADEHQAQRDSVASMMTSSIDWQWLKEVGRLIFDT